MLGTIGFIKGIMIMRTGFSRRSMCIIFLLRTWENTQLVCLTFRFFWRTDILWVSSSRQLVITSDEFDTPLHFISYCRYYGIA